jgi:hypothetical protein
MEALLQALANDIGQGLIPLEDILMRHNVSLAFYKSIENNPRFHKMVISAAKEWAAAENANQRVERKSTLMFEAALPEFYARMHDPKETLTAKVEMMKLLGKTGKLGATEAKQGAAGETFKLTINLGADRELHFEKELPVRVIDAEPLDG